MELGWVVCLWLKLENVVYVTLFMFNPPEGCIIVQLNNKGRPPPHPYPQGMNVITCEPDKLMRDNLVLF